MEYKLVLINSTIKSNLIFNMDKKIPKIQSVEKKLNEELMKYFKGEKDGYIQVGPKKWFYPMKYQKLALDYKNFEIRPDDIWITGVPRSGTTVTQEIAWLLSHNLDFENAKESLSKRVPFFETHMVFNSKTIQEKFESIDDESKKQSFLKDKAFWENTLKFLDEKNDRRVIKTHFPFELLPDDILKKGCKVIYVCRYPKDVAVSYYHLQSSAWHINFVGDFPKYWNFFQNGNCMFGPYFEHVKQAMELKENKNFLFVFYEDMKENVTEYIKKLSKFLERPLSEIELKSLEKHVDFDNFKKNKAVNPATSEKIGDFVRRGKSGGWRDYFTEDMNREADNWIEENIRKIGYKYPGN